MRKITSAATTNQILKYTRSSLKFKNRREINKFFAYLSKTIKKAAREGEIKVKIPVWFGNHNTYYIKDLGINIDIPIWESAVCSEIVAAGYKYEDKIIRESRIVISWEGK